MVYKPEEVSKWSDDVLLVAWEQVHGPFLSCSCCSRTILQPIEKFVKQIRHWCVDKGHGLKPKMQKPKTCDDMALENSILNEINNPYYREKRNLEVLGLPDDEIEKRLNELKYARDIALKEARALLARIRAAKKQKTSNATQAGAPLFKPVKLKTSREKKIDTEAARRLKMMKEDIMIEPQVRMRMEEMALEDNDVEVKVALRCLELAPIFC